MRLFGNVTKLEADITATEQALQPVLEKAGIKTAMRDGKVIPIADATNAEKFMALMAAQPIGTNLEERSSLLQSNDVVSKRCEKAESDLVISQTKCSTLERDNVSLQSNLNIAQASVQSLTSEKADLNNRLTAAVNQYTTEHATAEKQNSELSKVCVSAGVLDLNLEKDATEEAKTEAANQISFDDKLKAYRGAVNAAIAKTGANPLEIPSAPPTNPKKAELTGRARFVAAGLAQNRN